MFRITPSATTNLALETHETRSPKFLKFFRRNEDIDALSTTTALTTYRAVIDCSGTTASRTRGLPLTSHDGDLPPFSTTATYSGSNYSSSASTSARCCSALASELYVRPVRSNSSQLIHRVNTLIN